LPTNPTDYIRDMARTIPPDRFAQLIDAATKTFVARGYRLTQIADITDALGVAKGTVYRYVESKEALFDAAVRFADGQTPLPEPSALPLATPAPGHTVGYIRERLVAEARELRVVAALAGEFASVDARTELEHVVRDLYQRMARNRRALKLVDRCAVDHPELAAVWFEEGRWGQVALVGDYLERRIAEGRLRAVPSVPIAARMLLETIALWAIHMPWDPSPRPAPEADVENAVVDMLVHAYAKERPR
jgi:AcrR family transcriptional regulator